MLYIKQCVLTNKKVPQNKPYTFRTRVWYDYDNDDVKRGVVYMPFNITSSAQETKITKASDTGVILTDKFTFPESHTDMAFTDDTSLIFTEIEITCKPTNNYYSFPSFDIAKMNTIFNNGSHIGDIRIFSYRLPDNDYLKECNGQKLKRTDYSDLWEFNQITNYMTYDEDSITLPNITSGIKIGKGIATGGVIYPNHSHQYQDSHGHYCGNSHNHKNDYVTELAADHKKGDGSWGNRDGRIEHSQGFHLDAVSANVTMTIYSPTGDRWVPESFNYYAYIIVRL